MAEAGRVRLMTGSPMRRRSVKLGSTSVAAVPSPSDCETLFFLSCDILRPGEKLYEELMLDSEQDRMTKTAHDKIFIAPPMQIDLAAFYEELQNLRHDAEHNDEGVVLSLQRMVGTYHPNRVVNEDHTVSAAHGNTETIDKEELQKALDEQHSTQQNAQ